MLLVVLHKHLVMNDFFSNAVTTVASISMIELLISVSCMHCLHLQQVMRFYDPSYLYNQWHASDLVADFDAGGSGYSSRMSDFIDFTDIAHHSDPMIW